jgi:hypothetical protein
MSSSISSSQDPLGWHFYHNPRQPYDDFFSTYILKPLKFSFVQRFYDRPLEEFIRELPDLMHHFSTVHGPGGETWLAEIISQVQGTGIHSLFAFLDRVATRSQAQGYLIISGIPQPSLMDWIDYIKQWWFPYPATLRQLVEEDTDPFLYRGLAPLKETRIANSLTLLAAAAEPSTRESLSRQTGIEAADLLDLVHRADVSRLPYTSGGAVKRLWAMGYRSLAALRMADPQDYAERIEAYFSAGGKGSSFDARMSTIQGFLQDARHAPEVVKMGQ